MTKTMSYGVFMLAVCVLSLGAQKPPLGTRPNLGVTPTVRVQSSEAAVPVALIELRAPRETIIRAFSDEEIHLQRGKCVALHNDGLMRGFGLIAAGPRGLLGGVKQISTDDPTSIGEPSEELRELGRQVLAYSACVDKLGEMGYSGPVNWDQTVYVTHVSSSSSPTYTVHISDETPKTPASVTCRQTKTYEYEKVSVAAGFNADGTPRHEWRYAFVPHSRQTCP